MQYFPPIKLWPNKNYALGLVEFLTFKSILNVDIGCNKFYIDDKEIILPTDSYEISNIKRYLLNVLAKHRIKIYIEPNNNIFRSQIPCHYDIDFKPQDSIGRLLGVWISLN